MMQRVVTVNDVLDGHVALDIECLDRVSRLRTKAATPALGVRRFLNVPEREARRRGPPRQGTCQGFACLIGHGPTIWRMWREPQPRG